MHACTKATIRTHALGAACDAGVEEPGADGGGVVSHDDDALGLGDVVGLGGALELGGGVMVAGGVLGGGTYAGAVAGGGVRGSAVAGEAGADEAGVLGGASVWVGVARGADWAACAGAEPAVIVTAAVAPAPTSPDKTSVAVSGRQRPSRRAFRRGRPGAAVGSGPGTAGTGTGAPGGAVVVIVGGAAACARVTGSGSQPAAG
jgi:hypothetical protein